MDMQEKTAKVLENKNKIIEFIKNRGPSLPVHIMSELKISLLFASAFLSELLSEKKIKISNMKVGGSPLYFIQGQELMLANFSNYLHSKEKDAFVMLKENSVLEDEKMLPAIRVALRDIKDFAFHVTIETSNAEKKLFWRFLTLNEEEAKDKIMKMLAPKKEKKEEKKEKEKAEEAEKEKPLITLKEKRQKKPAEKSDFTAKSIKFLDDNKIELLEEIESKKKDFIAKIRVESDLGKIEFFAVFKDKKKITENDLALALQKGQSMKLPVFFASTGELDKKAQAYLESWKNLIKFKKMP